MYVRIVHSDARAREKPCLRCGRSLRKCLDEKHCPDCGLSVWLSLNGNDSLEWSRPAWLRTLALAALVMAAAQVLALPAYLLAVTSGGATAGAFRGLCLAAAGYLVLYHVGLLLMTAHERRYPDRLRVVRTVVRVVAGVGLLAAALMTAAAFRGRPAAPAPPPPAAVPATQPDDGAGAYDEGEEYAEGFDEYVLSRPARDPLWGLKVGLKIVAIASALATWAYLRRLARRMPSPALTRTCGYLMLLPLVSVLKVFPFFGLYMLGWLLPLLDYLPALYLPFTAVLLVIFARRFAGDAKSAAAAWAAETAVVRGGAPQPVQAG